MGKLNKVMEILSGTAWYASYEEKLKVATKILSVVGMSELPTPAVEKVGLPLPSEYYIPTCYIKFKDGILYQKWTSCMQEEKDQWIMVEAE